MAGCGQDTEQPADPAAPDEVTQLEVDIPSGGRTGSAIASVTVADTLGGEADVAALAFWSHPSLTFNSLVIAGAPDGLATYNVEDGALVERFDGAGATSLGVAYEGKGADAAGYVAAFDAGLRSLSVLSVSNSDRALSAGAAGALDALEICVVDGTADHLIALNGNSAAIHTLSADGFSAAPIATAELPGDLVSCAGRPAAEVGSAYILSGDGVIYALSMDGTFAELAETGIDPAISLGLVLKSDVEDANAAPYAHLIVGDGTDGTLRLFDGNDGHALGAFRLADSFDYEGVRTIAAMSAGFGNYGGVYRDGALAVAGASSGSGSESGGETGVVRLVPWNGVMFALTQPLGASVDPRNVAGDSPEESNFDFSVDAP